MNVNGSQLEATLDPGRAVHGAFVWRPSGCQTELPLLRLSSVWLFGRDFRLSMFCTEGHVGEHDLSHNVLVRWVQSLVCCSFDIFIFVKISYASQFGDEHRFLDRVLSTGNLYTWVCTFHVVSVCVHSWESG